MKKKKEIPEALRLKLSEAGKKSWQARLKKYQEVELKNKKLLEVH